MLSSIHPLGERTRGSSWSITTTAYVFGSVVGGTTLGVLGGSLGWLVLREARPEALLVVFGALAVLALLREWDLVKFALPSIHRQVDENWLLEYRGWVYGIGFGFQLGLGVVTIITTASLHLMIVAVVLGASPLLGALVGATFGLVRGGFVLLGRRIETPGALVEFHRVLSKRAPHAKLISRLSLLGAVVMTGIGVLA